MSLYKFFVAPDPLHIDPITGNIGKFDILTKEPNPIYPTIGVFVSWADAFNFIHRNDFGMNDVKVPTWEEIKNQKS